VPPQIVKKPSLGGDFGPHYGLPEAFAKGERGLGLEGEALALGDVCFEGEEHGRGHALCIADEYNAAGRGEAGQDRLCQGYPGVCENQHRDLVERGGGVSPSGLTDDEAGVFYVEPGGLFGEIDDAISHSPDEFLPMASRASSDSPVCGGGQCRSDPNRQLF